MRLPGTPFSGFSPETLQFFKDLKQNNDRDWFAANKAVYLDHVVEPAQAFIMALGSRLSGLHPGINYDTSASGSGSMFRIYRDVRFSQDKSPYKTHLGILFWIGSGKKTERPGYYFGLSDGPPQVYAGLHGFSKSQLQAYRRALGSPDTADNLADIVSVLRSRGYAVGGLHYKRVPRGFDVDHPHEALLRHNSVSARSPEIPLKTTLSEGLVEACFEHCVEMSPLNRWLLEMGS
jgi:uncharacterized protein (TIGR02453 family)